MSVLLLAALVSLPFAAIAWRRPLLRRLALRNASRRPREVALVLLGSMLGTAIITGSYVVGDTLDASITHGAYTLLGPVDEVVMVPTKAALARATAAVAGLSRTTGGNATHPPATHPSATLHITSVPITTVTAAVATSGSPGNSGSSAARSGTHVVPAANLIELGFSRGRRLGDSPVATGLAGPTPRPGHADIGVDLARSLHAGVGTRVTVYAYGTRVTVVVARVLPHLGLAGFNLGPGFVSPNIFVAPGTIGRMMARGAASAAPGRTGSTAAGRVTLHHGPVVAQPGQGPARAAPANAAPPAMMLAVSNGAGVLGGAARTAAATRQLDRALAGAGLGSLARVVPVKSDLLHGAHLAGKQFTQLFGGIGFFSVLAGVLLLVNIFVMLGEERRGELGMLRAIGLARSGLVATFSLEGWLYSVASAALGTVAGIGVGRLVVGAAASLFASGAGGQLSLGFAVKGSSLAKGFTIGLLISVATVVLGSLSIAKLNVIRAIRDLPEPLHAHRRAGLVIGAACLLGGVASFAAGLSSNSGFPVLIGPGVAAFGVIALAQRFRHKPQASRAAVSAAAAAALAWGTSAFVLVPKAFASAGIPIFVAQGVELTAAGVALVTQNQDLLGRLASWAIAGGRSLALRLGLAYPLARRFRTAMTLSMYALVMFMLTFVTVYSHLFASELAGFTREVSGGFAVQVLSNPADPVPVSSVSSLKGVTSVAPLSRTEAVWEAPFAPGGPHPWHATTFGPAFVSGGPPVLAKRSPAYHSDAAAYRALLAHPGLAIVSNIFLSTGGGPGPLQPKIGDKVVMRNPLTGASASVTIVALAHAGFGNTMALVSPATMRQVFGAPPAPAELFVKTAPGASASAIAARINSAGLAHGADATTFKSVVAGNLGQQEQFFRLMEGYLALGLLVGIAGLGVVMVRAVRERRREVGVLRSLGFPARSVRRAFLVESGFVATEGVVIGAALALVTAWRLATSGVFGSALAFSVPWLEVVALVGGTLLASLLATIAPAQQASRIRPAVALRIAD
ncbi:MAG: ABC transporter permease [Acidimicrobiales bacterium]